MVGQSFTKDSILAILSQIADPEIPVVNICEMGMVKDVLFHNDRCEVLLTPTYTGCPAMGIIEQDIRAMLHKYGVANVDVKLVYDPAWTTDWMNEQAKGKLKQYGIAPPLHSSCNSDSFRSNIIECPRCHSDDTVMLSRFGSTACKALYKCNSCKEPFEYFKCH